MHRAIRLTAPATDFEHVVALPVTMLFSSFYVLNLPPLSVALSTCKPLHTECHSFNRHTKQTLWF